MNKYEEIYIDIEGRILRKEYPAGSVLPSENEFAQIYQVSRETIRSALKMLLDNGYIFKKQGLGSIVLDHDRFTLPSNGLISHKELNVSQSLSQTTEVITNDVVPAPSFLVGQDGIVEGEPFIHLLRTRSKDGQAIIIDEDYIRQSVVSEIPDEKAQDSIYAYFEGDLGLNIGYAFKEMIGERATRQDMELLHILPTDSVIVVKSKVYLNHAEFFQYTISRHRMDQFQMREFAPRKNTIAINRNNL